MRSRRHSRYCKQAPAPDNEWGNAVLELIGFEKHVYICSQSINIPLPLKPGNKKYSLQLQIPQRVYLPADRGSAEITKSSGASPIPHPPAAEKPQ